MKAVFGMHKGEFGDVQFSELAENQLVSCEYYLWRRTMGQSEIKSLERSFDIMGSSKKR